MKRQSDEEQGGCNGMGKPSKWQLHWFTATLTRSHLIIFGRCEQDIAMTHPKLLYTGVSIPLLA